MLPVTPALPPSLSSASPIGALFLPLGSACYCCCRRRLNGRSLRFPSGLLLSFHSLCRMTSGQVQGSEPDISSLEDKDINGSEDSPQDKLGNDNSKSDSESSSESEPGNNSSKSNSESSSESEPDPEEANVNESNEELEKKETLLHHVESEFNIQQHCKHCMIQREQREQVTPKKISRGVFWLKLEAEGIYQCTITGLIFEVTKAATIEYSLLSWTKYAAYIKDPWIVVGPIFDVKCTASSTLNSIQFPHALCLNDHSSDVTFNVFHFKKGGPEFECSVDHSTTHVKWHVSSLSPVGPVIEKSNPVYYHGVVMLYKVINDHPSLKFRVYIASNNSSFIKDVTKTVKRSPNKFIKIEKPPCNKLLQRGRKYRLISDPEADINPEEMEFVDDSTLAEKHFFEVYLEQPVEFTLSLLDLESQDVIWKAKLRECDWVQNNQNNNNLKRSKSTQRRKSSTDISEDETYHKRFKGNDASDGSKGKVILTDQQLMVFARKMGKEWKAIGIEYLNLSLKDIEQIEAKEDDVNMCKCLMLRKWRDSERNNGTAQSLYACLNKDDSSYDLLESLKGCF